MQAVPWTFTQIHKKLWEDIFYWTYNNNNNNIHSKSYYISVIQKQSFLSLPTTQSGNIRCQLRPDPTEDDPIITGCNDVGSKHQWQWNKSSCLSGWSKNLPVGDQDDGWKPDCWFFQDIRWWRRGFHWQRTTCKEKKYLQKVWILTKDGWYFQFWIILRF